MRFAAQRSRAMKLPSIGIRLHGGLTPSACVQLATAAEQARFSAVWFAENAFARGMLPAAAACALATSRLQIGAGVFNPYNRHPALMAMEIGALDELSGGRATLSIGAGILSAAEKMGANTAKPLAAVRDAVTIVRRLLAGEEVDYAGSAFSARRIKLDYPARPDIPILVAGRGERMVTLAGELGDGVIVSNMCSVAFASRIAQLMSAARQKAGRPGMGRVVQYLPCAVHEDAHEAIAAGKHAIAEMLPGFWRLAEQLGSAKDALLAGTEISEQEFSASAKRLREGEDPTKVLDERYTAAFSLVGTPEQFLQGASRYAASGVTELALTFSGPRGNESIAAVGHAIQALSAG